ncbi:MAG: hypothetical protein AAFV95_13825 [Bacteroidota bacterium]
MKKKLLAATIGLLITLYGASLIRLEANPKQFSQDNQYSFYARKSLFAVQYMTAPGDGSATCGTIYVYDEVVQAVIYQFESSDLGTDLEASQFSAVDGGMFICKSGESVALPRPLKR